VRIVPALLVCIAFSSVAQENAPIFLGVDSNTPRKEAALLVVNEAKSEAGRVRCSIGWIRSFSHGHSGLAGEPVLMVVKPGRYTIGYAFEATMRDGVGTVDKKLDPGKMYRVNCDGKTVNQMRVVVREVEA